MGYGSFPKLPLERDMDLEARAADRERDMAHVTDALLAQDHGSGLVARVLSAIARLRPPRRRS